MRVSNAAPALLLVALIFGGVTPAHAVLMDIDLRGSSPAADNLGTGPILFGDGLLRVGAFYSDDLGPKYSVADSITQSSMGLGTGLGLPGIDNSEAAAQYQWLSLQATRGRIVELRISGLGVDEWLFVDSYDTLDYDDRSFYQSQSDTFGTPGDITIDVTDLPYDALGLNAEEGSTPVEFWLAGVVIDVPSSVPEPQPLMLLGLGVLGLMAQRRRGSNQHLQRTV